MMTAKYELDDYEVERFNANQAAKIISIRQKRMANEKAKKAARHTFFGALTTIIIVLTIAAISSSYIYKNSLVSEAKYDIYNLKTEIKSLNAQIEELSAKIENQSGLKNIEQIAIETLNMQYPTKEQMVYVDQLYAYALPVGHPDEIIDLAQSTTSDHIINDLVTALFKTHTD